MAELNDPGMNHGTVPSRVDILQQSWWKKIFENPPTAEKYIPDPDCLSLELNANLEQ